MRIIHLSTSDSGGAGIAATRIHTGLLNEGVSSAFVSLHKFREDVPNAFSFKSLYKNELNILEKASEKLKKATARLDGKGNYYSRLEKKYLTGRPAGFELFTLPFSEYDVSRITLLKNADIVHIHWATEGFIDYGSFFKKIGKKVVWTLHDMNPFTGGCHHSDECYGFTNKCENCPQLKGTIDENLAAEILSQKGNSLHEYNSNSMSVIAPSQWMMNRSKQSKLFSQFTHAKIANPVEEEIYYPYDKVNSRAELGLPPDKKIILFIANDIDNPRKGLYYLFEAFKKLNHDNNAVLCSVGKMNSEIKSNMPLINMGYVNDESKMAKLYSAADVFILPSMAENLPNTISESLMCGTPVIAFNVGGIPKMINEQNGILVRYKDSEQLKNAIELVLTNGKKYEVNLISKEAKEEYSMKKATAEYLKVYNRLLD